MSPVEREVGPKVLAVEVQHRAIVRCVRNEQDDALDAAISAFECTPAIECLDVAQPGFRLNRSVDAIERRDSVPRASVTGKGEGYLSAKPRRGRQEPSEPSKKRELPGVDCRIGIRNGSNEETQADCRACTTQLIDRNLLQLATLDPTELGVRYSDNGASLALADATRHSGATDLASHLNADEACHGQGCIQAARSGRHAEMVKRNGSPRLIPDIGEPGRCKHVHARLGSLSGRTSG